MTAVVLPFPPSEPVRWLVIATDGRRRLGRVIEARTWFDAREQATRIFGLPRDCVVAERWPLESK